MNRLMATVMAMVVGASALGWAQGAATNAAAKAAATVEQGKGGLKLDGGGDLRFRDELKRELPGTGVAAKKFENLLRLRSRLWGSASYEDYTLYGRPDGVSPSRWRLLDGGRASSRAEGEAR